jgi:hypothetical protein
MSGSFAHHPLVVAVLGLLLWLLCEWLGWGPRR